MRDILVKPADLHSIAGHLHDRAAIIAAAMRQVDEAIGTLGTENFAGSRADALHARYQAQRGHWLSVIDTLRNLAVLLTHAAVAFTAADGQDKNDEKPPPGYVDSDNVGQTSAERIEDLKDILAASSTGRRVAAWLDQYAVAISFADLPSPPGTRRLAACSFDGKIIIIDDDLAAWSDYELAAILMHEGQHSLNTHPFDQPLIGPVLNELYNIADDTLYVLYPYPEEYRAFAAEAVFWREVKSKYGLDDNADLERVAALIFDSNEEWRDRHAVYCELDKYYQGLLRPLFCPSPSGEKMSGDWQV